MSIFYCHRCQNNADRDWVGCVEDPDGEFWLMCADHEEKCARCEHVIGKKEDKVDTNFDAVCDGCWNKVVA